MLWLAPLAWVACSQPKELEKPAAPDMSELVSAYERPTGTFDASAAPRLRTQLDTQVAELEQSDLVKQLEDALGTTLAEAEANVSAKPVPSASRRLQAFMGSGFLRATRICNGWKEPPTADKGKNGFIELVVGFTDSHLDPVVFGAFADCRYLAAGGKTLLTSANPSRPSLNIHLGDTEQSSEFGEYPVTFELNLRGSLGEDAVRLQFDFRVNPKTGATEHRLESDGGDVVVSTNARGDMRVRAKNGEFVCTADFECRVADTDAGSE